MYIDKPIRDFKGVWICKEIWLNPDFRRNRFERDLLIELYSLDNENGCFANNRYFADFFFCTPGNISHAITKLQKKGYVTVTYKNNTTYEGRVIRVNKSKVMGLSTPEPEVATPIPELHPPIPELKAPIPEVLHNNTFTPPSSIKNKEEDSEIENWKPNERYQDQVRMSYPDLGENDLPIELLKFIDWHKNDWPINPDTKWLNWCQKANLDAKQRNQAMALADKANELAKQRVEDFHAQKQVNISKVTDKKPFYSKDKASEKKIHACEYDFKSEYLEAIKTAQDEGFKVIEIYNPQWDKFEPEPEIFKLQD